MIKLDDQLLARLGLGFLPDDHKRMLLKTIYDELEFRVGTALAKQMTEWQLTEFEQFISDGGATDQTAALTWLNRNLPHYRETVNEEFEKLCSEVAAQHEEITAASVFYTE